jgi:alpha-tubulin suppressor-like RCC1 family protein
MRKLARVTCVALLVLWSAGCFVDRRGARSLGDAAVPDASGRADAGPGRDGGAGLDAGPAPDAAADGGLDGGFDGGRDAGADDGGLRMVQVTAGERHTCALRSDGVVFCWGDTNADQLGPGPTSSDGTFARAVTGLPGPAVRVAAGAEHTCAGLADGSVHCWGANASGQIGDGTDTDPHPMPGAAFDRAAAVGAGGEHTCLIDDGGRIGCWGANDHLQLGLTGEARSTPASLAFPPAGRVALALALGLDHTCALVDDGLVYCWGHGGDGRLGDAATEDRATPRAVDGLTGVTAVGGGDSHGCAVHAGSLSCWGLGSSGQLGNGATDSSGVPVPVSLPPEVEAVEVGGGIGHTCARTSTGDVHCWGTDSKKQLGGGGDRDVPGAALGGLPGPAEDLAVGGEHNCVVTRGEVWCWGRNHKDQLGTAGGDRGAPMAVPGLLP